MWDRAQANAVKSTEQKPGRRGPAFAKHYGAASARRYINPSDSIVTAESVAVSASLRAAGLRQGGRGFREPATQPVPLMDDLPLRV